MVEISKLIKSKKKKIKSKKCISKKNYLNKVKDIQNSELKSNRYRWIKEFVDNYNNRGDLKEEKILLEMLLNYNVYYFNDNYDVAHDDYIKTFNQVKDFIDSLDEEMVDNNIYFSIAKRCFTESVVDCTKILLLLKKHMNHTDIFEEWKSISFKTFLSSDRLGYLLKEVNEEVSISLKKIKNSYNVNVSVLNQDNIHYYYEYNKIVSIVNKMCENICRLQLWNLLNQFEEEIDNCYFKIENNEFQKAFSVSFYIRVKKEDVSLNDLNYSVIENSELDSNYSYKYSDNVSYDYNFEDTSSLGKDGNKKSLIKIK